MNISDGNKNLNLNSVGFSHGDYNISIFETNHGVSVSVFDKTTDLERDYSISNGELVLNECSNVISGDSKRVYEHPNQDKINFGD